MNSDKEYRLKEIKKKIVKIQRKGIIAPVLVGLSGYGIWGADGDAFHPLLNNTLVTYSMLGVGIVGLIWELDQLMPLFREQKKLTSNKNT